MMDGDAMVSGTALGQHLLFHKALIDDRVGSEKIDRYVDILKNQSDGERMLDPTDESIRSVFSLVLEHGWDPWEIDLREFVRLYSDKVSNSYFDMIVAGKLILMAWKILRMQSDATLQESERPDEEADCFDLDLEMYDDVDPMFVPSVALRETYRRTPTRPVTVMELLDAFEEARLEIEIQQERERKRLELKAKEPRKFDNKAHEEDDETVIERVWEKIQKLGTGALQLRDLYTADTAENITIIVSVLHLVRDGKLSIWQESMPFGEIFVEIKVDWASGTVEDAKKKAELPEAVV